MVPPLESRAEFSRTIQDSTDHDGELQNGQPVVKATSENRRRLYTSGSGIASCITPVPVV
jgi:hypothetical protein